MKLEKSIFERIIRVTICLMTIFLLVGCTPDKEEEKEEKKEDTFEEENDVKPVIYLYPTKEMDVTVSLAYEGELTTTYPKYEDGWSVKASPDGTLYNYKDGNTYRYLFWEGQLSRTYSFDEGFVVTSDEAYDFLLETLPAIGLIPEEYNEMIVYWLPILEQHPYSLVYFAEEEYTDTAELVINPRPDSLLRVFMVVKPLEEPIQVKEQELKSFQRAGFTVVEWGGCVLKESKNED